MSDAISTALLAAAVLWELACTLGALLAADVYTRLHFVSAASGLGALLVAAALIVHEGLGLTEVKVVLVPVALIVISPVLVQATARAARSAGAPVAEPRRPRR